MKKLFLPLLILMAGCTAAPTEPVIPEPDMTLTLYPQGQAVDLGIVEDGVAVTLGPGADNGLGSAMELGDLMHYSKVGDEAFMSIWLPEKCNGRMLIICPGGGYRYCSGENEGVCVAKWCVEHGIAACMLIYRMPQGNPYIPLTDVQNAFRYCRHHAAEWGVETIGTIGFSAGGHLVSTASTKYVDSITRPDFSIMVYGFMDLSTWEFSGSATRCNQHLTANDPALMEEFTAYKHVTSDTPPALLLLSTDDPLVSPINSIGYYDALVENGVPAEMHILRDGGHGWGFRTAPIGEDKLTPGTRALVSSIIGNWLGI